jgi:hypothetical protein
MKNLQQTLDALQPYVIGIRYVEKMTVVDTIFKTGWTLLDSKTIKKVKGEDDTLNYYMIFSDVANVGLDEILDYVSNVIKINLEREKKHELLRVKVNELKDFFKKHSLNELTKLKFMLAQDQLMPDLNEFDVDVDEDIMSDSLEKEASVEVLETKTDVKYHTNEELSEEEKEYLEEEARAANFQKMKEAQKANGVIKTKQKVELPPRKKIGEAIMSNTLTPDCDCGPLEACDKCIEFKDL